MQTVLILALFSMLITIMSSFVMGAGSSTAQLSQQRIAETKAYFRNIELVVNEDLTPAQLEAAPASQTAAQVLQQNAVAQMAPGSWGNPLVDAWGTPLRIPSSFPRANIALANGVMAPITGFVLISAGPDRTFQTSLPVANTLASLQGVVPPTGSDDIVVTFTNEDSQRRQLAILQARLERIAAAMLRHYRLQLSDYRGTIETNYRTALQNNPGTPPPNWATLLTSDPNAPQFVDLRNTNARPELGVAEEFDVLEKLWPNDGRMEVGFIETNPDLRLSATLVLRHTSSQPWPFVDLRVPIRGGV
jgi:hypothetical protein